ncbi:MAG: tetratricopeptide repeat protein [Rhodothermales bacterium]
MPATSATRRILVILLLAVAGAAWNIAPATAQSPADSLHFLEGKAAFDAGRFDEAIEHLTAFVEQSPGAANAYYYLARAYAVQGNEPDATRSINRAIDRD